MDEFETLYEGENYAIYRIEDEDGEVGYDVTLFDTITVHFLQEEWDEFVEIIKSLKS